MRINAFSKLHTSSSFSGHYLYVEASIKHKKDDAVRLVSPDVNVKNACLTFYHNMNGAATGELQVKVLTAAGPKKMWSKKGHHGKRWIKTEVDISERRPYKVRANSEMFLNSQMGPLVTNPMKLSTLLQDANNVFQICQTTG